MARNTFSNLLIAIVLAAGAVGCDGSSPAPEPPPQAPSPPAAGAAASPTEDESAAGRCPNHARAVAEGRILGGKSEGDVDGDGLRDEVYLVTEPTGPPDCRNFLVIEPEGRILAAPTTEEGVEYALETPRVNGIVQIDGSGGEEILVDLERGASTQFIGIFTVVDGDLRRVEVQERTDFGNLFPYGGSVGHLEASNCTDRAGADISVAVATANATDYTIRTRLYEMNGASLVPLPRDRQPPISIGTDLDQIEGFATSPFGDCP